MTTPVVDPDFEGYVDLRAHFKRAQINVLAAAHRVLEQYKDPERFVTEILNQRVANAVHRALGFRSFDELEADSPLGRALLPRMQPIAEKWVAKMFEKPLPPKFLASMQAAFMRGFDRHLDKLCYRLGEELAQKYQEHIRYELLGGMDFVEQTEKKMTR
jgi:hypothetical protein